MIRTRAPAALLVGLLCLTGCKGGLEPDWSTATAVEELRTGADRPFLGVVVDREDPGSEVGLRIRRLLRQGAAERAGLRPGDVLVRLGSERIRSSVELGGRLEQEGADPKWQSALRDWRDYRDKKARSKELNTVELSFLWAREMSHPTAPTVELDLTVLRGDEELVLPARLGSGWDYERDTTPRLQELAKQHQGGIYLPFLLDTTTRAIPAEEWLLYRGRAVSEPVLVYDEVDVLPVLLASLFRWEAVPLQDSRRVTVGHWPLQLTWQGDPGSYLRSIQVPGEERHALH